MLHSPVRGTSDSSSTAMTSRGGVPPAEHAPRHGDGNQDASIDRNVSEFRGRAPPLQPPQMGTEPFGEPTIESVTTCRVPPFWKQQPALWFAQIESLFQIYRVRSDDSRYHLVIGALDSKAIQEIADILATPPEIDKYVTLKTQLLARFADSANKQLHRLLTDLELGGRKPSQLLRHMKTLAGSRVSEDVLRVRWLALLPPAVQRVLKILRTTSLDELSSVADDLMEGTFTPQVLAVTTPQAPSPVRGSPALAASNQDIHQLQEAVTTMQQTVCHLTTLFERLLPRVWSTRDKLLIRDGRVPGRAPVAAQLDREVVNGATIIAVLAPLPGSATNPAATGLQLLRQPMWEIDAAVVGAGGRRQHYCTCRKKTPRLAPAELRLFAANSTAISTYGQEPLTLNLGLRRAFRWSFIIADVSSAILGADFLAHYGLVIDLSRRSLVDSHTSLITQGAIRNAATVSISAVGQHNLADSPQRDAYASLLQRHAAVFTPRPTPSAFRSDRTAHHIRTTGPPVFARPRRLSGDRLAAAKADFDLLLHLGVVQPSHSQWASPIHIVPKDQGGWRTTGDYRRLNAQTVSDRYPVPRIDDILQRMHGKRVFSTIDLVRAYHQIPIAPEDVPKTAVTTPFGLFEFLGMPPGLRNATQTFQRHMDGLLRGIDFAACYIDDIIVFSNSHEEHLQHLAVILELLQGSDLPVDAGKSFFAQDSVQYLGYTVSQSGLKPPQDKVRAIEQFPKPETVTELHRFLGMTNYYRRILPNAAKRQALLTAFLKDARKKNKRKILWTPEFPELVICC
ncbi:uncharacterized protein LOC116851826 [Odontomachus brunneus]|uniref:uncharacterized protein LOC116851826 n=1 Tax=Odontomachus brunneus TaxID=486640 RepID=UPI0013F18D86|nr:uncharacterized protein LOC116851826 [Odontomachus brunneus]